MGKAEMKWYRLVFEQIQPMHIKKSSYGVMAETELFIPGQSMWGALTRSYNLYCGAGPDENRDLFSAITCFYPSFDGVSILAPSYRNGMLFLGENITEDEFRFAYTDTFVSTAISPLTGSAADESLHETDILLPRPKYELADKGICNKANLKWIGLLGLGDDGGKAEGFLKENGLDVHIGGEIRYGLGLLVLREAAESDVWTVKEWNINEEGRLHLENGRNILRNFLQIDSGVNDMLKWKGAVVPLAELDFKRNEPVITEACLYLNTGSSVCVENMDDLDISGFRLSKGKLKRIERAC